MFGIRFGSSARRALAGVAGIAVAGMGMTALGSEAVAAEIVITINKIKALDKADELSEGDFFARMRINGKAAFSPVQTGKSEFSPGWKLTLPAKSGVNEVNLALIDKDVAVDDPIDINRVAGKRDLDFTVNTSTCRIVGFAESYRCGQTITRSGGETKKATLSFTVDVRK